MTIKKKGFTLLELLIVIVIIALGAAAVMPSITVNHQSQVDLAAGKVATALRITRSEAIRTGIAHGVIVDHDDSEATGKDIVVYQLDTSGNPFLIDHVVMQPVSKLPYDISLVDTTADHFIVFRNATSVFIYDTVGASQHLHFDPTGRPVYYQNGVPHRLLSGVIQLGEGASSRSVTLSALSGQVTVQ